MDDDELLTKTVRDAVEHVLTRFGFRIGDGPNEIQEDVLFLRRLRLGNPLARLERIELQMAEHEKRDEERQREILRQLEDAKEGREIVHRRITDLKSAVAAEFGGIRTALTTQTLNIIGEDGPVQELKDGLKAIRDQNRNALVALVVVLLGAVGAFCVKYVI